MSSLRIRFNFNRQGGGKAVAGPAGSRGIYKYANAVVDQVAFKYSERVFDRIKNEIEQRIEHDVSRELNHMAQMFMTKVVGIGGRNLGPRGSMSTVAPLSEAMQGVPNMSPFVRSLTGTWKARSSFYMQSRAKYGTAWFQRTGGTLAPLGAGPTWSAAYGGINVDVRRQVNVSGSSLQTTSSSYSDRSGKRVSVAVIRVSAMQRITPGMLPALAAGGPVKNTADGRRSGLLRMLGQPIANRLGGNPVTVPFRPTIEPFLGYFLTRQLPNAVFKRIEQGFEKGRWSRMDVGSAGRRG